MYGCILEALELESSHPRTSMSFLNVGSGTGYLSCIVANILGPSSANVQYGVEIHEDVIEHCHSAIEKWQQSDGLEGRNKECNIRFAHGNGLHIDHMQGEARVGFDRIYVGATLRSRDLHKLTRLLLPNGVLVSPMDSDDLVKVRRTDCGDYIEEAIACVRFATLLPSPAQIPVLPSQVWSRSQHSYYPKSFRNAVLALLLCSKHRNIMPSELWVEVLSYVHRHWFDANVDDSHTRSMSLLAASAASKKRRLLSALHLQHPRSRRRRMIVSSSSSSSFSDDDIEIEDDDSSESDGEVEEEDVNMLAVVMHDMNMAFPVHLLMREGVVGIDSAPASTLPSHEVVASRSNNAVMTATAIRQESSSDDDNAQLRQERRTVSLGEEDMNE